MNSLADTERVRLAALRALEVLYTPPEEIYDQVTRVARELFSAPIALISLIDAEEQWFKACVGLDRSSTPRGISFCTYAIAQEDLTRVFVVPDATRDLRFMDNILVTDEPRIRFYAGAPLVTHDGQAVGTLCVIDTVARQPTPRQLDALKVLANTVITNMELRQSARDLRASEEFARLVIHHATEAVIVVNQQRVVEEWNAQAQAIFGPSEAQAYGHPIDTLLMPDATDADRAALLALFDVDRAGDGDEASAPMGARRPMELTLPRADGTRMIVEFSVAHMTPRVGGTRFALFARDVTAQRMAERDRAEAATRDVVIFALARLAESRDAETGAHVERVQAYCQALAEHLAATGYDASLIDPEFVHLMHTTSPLHDIGKVGIPDEVLLKPGKLTPSERAIMQRHTTIGAQTLEAAMRRFPNTRFLQMARNIAATHHERYDGTGYPAGLKGNDIPLCGRIVALADVYDALTTRRVYKPAFTHAAARDIIVAESGKQFDPAIVEAFLAIERRFIEIAAADELASPLTLAA